MQAITRIVKNAILVEELKENTRFKRRFPKGKDVRHRILKYINSIQDNITLTGTFLHKVIKTFIFRQQMSLPILQLSPIGKEGIGSYQSNNTQCQFSSSEFYDVRPTISPIWVGHNFFCFSAGMNNFALCAWSICSSFISERKRADICWKQLFEFSDRIAFRQVIKLFC